MCRSSPPVSSKAADRDLNDQSGDGVFDIHNGQLRSGEGLSAFVASFEEI